MSKQATLTLGQFLALTHEADVEVCVKEPGECAKYWTTFAKRGLYYELGHHWNLTAYQM